MADVLSKWEELRVLFESIEVDIKKTAKGNKTAGVRSRKGLRLLKKAAGDLVKETIEAGKEEA